MLSPIIQNRIEILGKLKQAIVQDTEGFNEIIFRAYNANNWFTEDSVRSAVDNILEMMLDVEKLTTWIPQYPIIATSDNNSDIKVGLVMAGNIPLVGFHDFLCLYVAGVKIKLKMSSKDSVLFNYVINHLHTFDTELQDRLEISEMLKGCDAYIATGSNNTSRYFEQYFGKYPNIIRKNRTSVAVLIGNESAEDLDNIVKDVTLYYGLGCRNISKLYVPIDYDVTKIMQAFDQVKDLQNHHKYKNNYDYHLAIYLLNNVNHYSNEAILLVENKEKFAPIASLYFERYEVGKVDEIISSLQADDDIQVIATNVEMESKDKITSLGNTQKPSLNDYADGVDTMQFLSTLLR